MPSFFHPIWLLISPVSSRKVICTGLWSELSKPVSMTFDCSTVTLAETRKPSTVRRKVVSILYGSDAVRQEALYVLGRRVFERLIGDGLRP